MDSKEHLFVNFSNASQIDHIYQKYLQDPESIDPSFRDFFRGMAYAERQEAPSSHSIEKIIETYRRFGHLKAKLNPLKIPSNELSEHAQFLKLGIEKRDQQLQLPTYGLLEKDLAPLHEILKALERIYCSTLGVEANLADFPDMEADFYRQVEALVNRSFDRVEKGAILQKLYQAEAFETFLQSKMTGHKRFSIEGGETLLVLLAKMLDMASESGVKEVVMGMAHRGRLNVLANIFSKPLEQIFYEFEPHSMPHGSAKSGDVKYHKGFRSKWGSLMATLCPNPSHLEAVNPVVMGRARALQVKLGVEKVIPVIIHGDAAVAGQGIVYETLQMEKLEGFQNGGVIHVVVNNQIGFTATSQESRSTRYCTDIAKAFNIPVYHVNGDDPEMCARVAELALFWRQKYQTSVMIDLICYRKYGHNETDEPRFTQPLAYLQIGAKESVASTYLKQLIEENAAPLEEFQKDQALFQTRLEEARQKALEIEVSVEPQQLAEGIVSTTVNQERLFSIAEKLPAIPLDFTIHPKLKRMIADRKENIFKSVEKPLLDFAVCEQLAYATLLLENIPIRIVGEDSRRGTFSHRHAVLIDQQTEQPHYQLNHLSSDQALITVYNSLLSEYAAMGFEYGFSVQDPKTLVIWEAQFGDFVNCAQVMIDQFLVSGDQKWNETSNLVLWLPHGYEGMGPEHSSARIERFLQLAAQNNMEIIYPTLAAQLFHALRRQALKSNKCPLIIFAPKALLRQPAAYSKLSDLTDQGFQDLVIHEPEPTNGVTHLVLTTGQFVHEVLKIQKENAQANLAVARIEKLYPLDPQAFQALWNRYPRLEKVIYAQDEPMNMGALNYVEKFLQVHFPKYSIECISRPESASTAAGSSVLHQYEERRIIDQLIKKL